MRHMTLALVLAACGGGAKTGPSESTALPADNAKEAGPDQAPPANLVAEQQEPAPPAPVGPPIWDRIHVATGPVPGLDAFSIELKDNAAHCGGKQMVTTRNKKKKIAKADQALADFFAEEFPMGLDFTEGDEAKATFDTWFTHYTELGKKANDQYDAELSAAKDDAAKVAAAARMSQLTHRIASVFTYAEIPVNLRTGESSAEATEAFCEQMAVMADPLLARANELAMVCTEYAKTVTVKKSVWWQQICVVPAS